MFEITESRKKVTSPYGLWEALKGKKRGIWEGKRRKEK